ncbi:hypothetical protein CONLIGDRAFT_627315 [Coniochaeta ligniaria NRRL 30616]|uniref:Cyanovirin-N domain-containing protein n=1 Tax=Coniochaeta ligniaria NRRL 30616 TaxID=1408157 RepID=A0A1J7K4V8_9PEZI|nr:hypothetical protein CONLIGDRAFT_627315 [Coniochaeta ligniaria NRRL 30616]
MTPSLNQIARLILVFAPIAAKGQASPSPTSCADGHFIGSCAYPGLRFVDHALGMYCLNDNTAVFGYNWTWLDLDKCLTNNDGKLTPSSIGDYSSSCFNCNVSYISGVHLTCDCWNMAGTNQLQASVDLNSVIYNTNGAMGCCDQLGNKTWKGPQAG